MIYLLCILFLKKNKNNYQTWSFCMFSKEKRRKTKTRNRKQKRVQKLRLLVESWRMLLPLKLQNDSESYQNQFKKLYHILLREKEIMSHWIIFDYICSHLLQNVYACTLIKYLCISWTNTFHRPFLLYSQEISKQCHPWASLIVRMLQLLDNLPPSTSWAPSLPFMGDAIFIRWVHNRHQLGKYPLQSEAYYYESEFFVPEHEFLLHAETF